MKTTTIAMSAALALALAACADNTQPAREPTTTATQTTTSTSYPAPQHTSSTEGPSSLSGGHETAGRTTTTGSENMDGSGSYAKQTPLPRTPDPALVDPDANGRAVQPGPANAKQPDGKSSSAAAVTDQGNSKSEVQISARIRKSMMASSTLSFGAKNAKIITQGTKVTLRGTVKTDAERTEIEGTARNTDGVTEVDNQIVVNK